MGDLPFPRPVQCVHEPLQEEVNLRGLNSKVQRLELRVRPVKVQISALSLTVKPGQSQWTSCSLGFPSVKWGNTSTA